MFNISDITIINLLIIFGLVCCESLFRKCAAPGKCVELTSCKPMYDEMNSTKSFTSLRLKYLRSLRCNKSKNVTWVCCDEYQYDNELLDKNCGAMSIENKIIHGDDAELDDFPWMVVLEYKIKDDNETKFACAGSLINDRYVLTAAHCLDGIGELKQIRLGEYHLLNTTDCVLNVCTNVVIRYAEEIILHPHYDGTTGNNANDIGLIRLSEPVNNTDFIKPVCLPITVNMADSPTNTIIEISGWGKTSTNGNANSLVKQKLAMKIYDHSLCKAKFGNENQTITKKQLCAGGETLKDACTGDSGGPLMALMRDFYVLEGIVSFGKGCGNTGWPGVYTRTSSFQDWILINMRP